MLASLGFRGLSSCSCVGKRARRSEQQNRLPEPAMPRSPTHRGQPSPAHASTSSACSLAPAQLPIDMLESLELSKPGHGRAVAVPADG